MRSEAAIRKSLAESSSRYQREQLPVSQEELSYLSECDAFRRNYGWPLENALRLRESLKRESRVDDLRPVPPLAVQAFFLTVDDVDELRSDIRQRGFFPALLAWQERGKILLQS